MAADNLEKLVPDRRLSLDGEIVGADLAGKITRITVDLSDGVFNECRIVFTDPDMKLIGGKKLMGGVQVLVELGYIGKLKPVFDGEIVSVEPRFVRDQPPSVIVRCMEQLHRLALAPKTRSFQDATATQILQHVAKEHGLSGEGPAGGSTGHLLQPNISDYALLTKIAARTGHRIALDGKKLMLAPPPSLGDMDVLPGDGVKRLKVALRSTEQVPKVIVRGWDWKQKKEIVGQATPAGEASDGADAAKPFSRGDYFIEGVLVGDTAEAQAIAKSTIARISERFAIASGEMVGSPDLIPGKVLAFDKLGELLDGKYRITSARHEFDKKGYKVHFESTRVAKKKTVAKFKAPPEIKEEETTFIESALVDQSGKPMSGVRVTIEVAGEAPQNLVTDAKGKVRLDKVKKGKSYSITFHDPNESADSDEAKGPYEARNEAGAPKPQAGAPIAEEESLESQSAEEGELAEVNKAKDSKSADVDVHQGDEGAKGTNESTTVDASDPKSKLGEEKLSDDPEKKLEKVAIEGAPGPFFCGDTITVSGQGTKLTAGASAQGSLFAADGSPENPLFALDDVTIASSGAVKGQATLKGLDGIAKDGTIEVKGHLFGDGAKGDSSGTAKLARVADFSDEGFSNAPSHKPQHGFANLVPKYIGSFDGRELSLKIRIKYRQGWRRWVYMGGVTAWADRGATGWKIWDAAKKAWADPPAAVHDSNIREVVCVKNDKGELGAWYDAWYTANVGGHPATMSNGKAVPDYTLGASELEPSISSIKEAWDDRFVVKRKGCTGGNDCCRYVVRVEPVMDSSLSSYDFEINYVGAGGGAGRANVTNWYDMEEFTDDSDSGTYSPKSAVRKFVHAHEVGHMMGSFDEYDGGATGPDNLLDSDSIMGSGVLSNVNTNSKPLVRHVKDIQEFFRQVVARKHPKLGWDFELKLKSEA